MIDARLHGERDRVLPRVFARPLEIRRGDNVSQKELLDRLNDLGYAQRTQAQNPGEFAVDGALVSVVPRAGTHTGKTAHRQLSAAGAAAPAGRARRPPATISTRIEALVGRQAGGAARHAGCADADRADSGARQAAAGAAVGAAVADGRSGARDRRPALLLAPGCRSRSAWSARSSPTRSAIVRTWKAPARSRSSWRAISSSPRRWRIEQQTRQRSLRRKLREQFMAIVLDIRATKDEVLELYLNDVYLGNRGSFAIHGVAEAARLYFGKDVNNLSLGEAATIAGIIQSPDTLSPFNAPARARERRNVVLRAMATRRLHLGRCGRARRRRSRFRRSPARSTPRRRTSSTSSARRSRSSSRPSRRRPRPSMSTRRSTCTCSGSRRTR